MILLAFPIPANPAFAFLVFLLRLKVKMPSILIPVFAQTPRMRSLSVPSPEGNELVEEGKDHNRRYAGQNDREERQDRGNGQPPP